MRHEYQYLYKTKQWQRLRAEQLRKYPYCQCPHHKEKKELAAVVDHISPHKGNRRLFFDRNNLQSMTKTCHDAFKQSQERGGAGFDKGCDEMGQPLNKEHSWYHIR